VVDVEGTDDDESEEAEGAVERGDEADGEEEALVVEANDGAEDADELGTMLRVLRQYSDAFEKMAALIRVALRRAPARDEAEADIVDGEEEEDCPAEVVALLELKSAALMTTMRTGLRERAREGVATEPAGKSPRDDVDADDEEANEEDGEALAAVLEGNRRETERNDDVAVDVGVADKAGVGSDESGEVDEGEALVLYVGDVARSAKAG